MKLKEYDQISNAQKCDTKGGNGLEEQNEKKWYLLLNYSHLTETQISIDIFSIRTMLSLTNY